MALRYYPEKEVNVRMDELVEEEARICAGLPFRAALH
jgi:hypothetical protein